MIKRRKKRNPVLESEVNKILNKLDPKYVFYLAEGDYSEVYKFEIIKNKEIDDTILKKGTYVIKFLRQNDYLDSADITYLKKLSKLKVIPKIYVITKKYIIMDFIKGDTLRYRLEGTKNIYTISRLLLNLGRLISNLHDKGIAHGDLHLGNVLIDENDDLYLIDPVTNSKNFENDNKRLSVYRNRYLDE